MRSQLTSFHLLRLSRPFFFFSSCQTLIETTSRSQSKDHHRFYCHLALSDRRGCGLREAKTRKNRNMLSLCLIHRFCSKVDRKSCSLKAEKAPYKLPQPVDVSKLAVIDMPALYKLKAERDPEKLFHLFKANAHNRSVVENRFAFEDTISRLAGARRFDYIEQLLEQQKALPQGRREGFIIRIIMLYGKAGMPDLAVKTFYDMHLFGCNRSVKSFNATLRVLTQAKIFDEIHSFFIEIPKKFGISPDGFSCNIVIKAFCEMGCLRSAYLIMEEMEKAGISPDVVTYSTLISAFYRNDRREIADGLWNLMVIRKCFPNLFTFNIRIQYLVNKRRPWLANRLMRKMVVLGINPDELTFNLIIKGFCKVGNLDMAKRIYDSLHSKGCRPNSKIYQTMIHYLCEGGEFDLAYTLCKDSMGKSWFPSIDSICKLLEGLIQNSKHRKSREIMRLIQGPLSLYRSLVEEGKLQYDFYQERVASELEDLLGRLEQYEMDMEEYHVNLANWEKNREKERRRLLMEEAEAKQQQGGVRKSINKHQNGFFEKWILRRKNVDVEPGVGKMVSYLNREKKMDAIVGTRPVAPPAPKGLYLYGNVGSGKTMLMDMFYSATEGIVRHRRRFHFHEAMLEIHEHMHKIWKNQMVEKSSQSVFSSWIGSLPFDTKVKEWMAAEEQYKQEVRMKHILPDVADRFLVNRQTDQVGASILCFDEIQTVDVFAIVALSGIVSRLLSTGTVLVATSNRAPEDLNQDGMQREIFQKLVSHLGEHCQNILVGSEIDYRRLIAKRTVEQVHYFWPLDDQAFKEFEKMWCKIINESGGRIVSDTIRVMFGRILEVPESCNGVARFTFDYLCGRPVGAADYIAVAKNYHTVFISDIPVMSMRIRDKARRFITLIDELYNHHCCLYCTAASSVDDLFQGTDEGPLFDLESFQFETEIEGGKLRRDVLTEGSMGSGAAPAGISSLLSGQEETFAFRRAVSRLIEMQTPLYLEGVQCLHPYFSKPNRELLSIGFNSLSQPAS